jgi:D-lyxose ketol-isomerase
MLSRSMMQLMVELGACIDVPEEHLDRGMTFRAPTGPQETRLMEIRSARLKPGRAFVAIPYQGHWYWIEEGDFRSKRMLSLLMIFLSMTESGGGAGAPVVTVSAG